MPPQNPSNGVEKTYFKKKQSEAQQIIKRRDGQQLDPIIVSFTSLSWTVWTRFARGKCHVGTCIKISQKGFVSKRCHRGANKVKRKHEENGAPRGTVLCDEAIVFRVVSWPSLLQSC